MVTSRAPQEACDFKRRGTVSNQTDVIQFNKCSPSARVREDSQEYLTVLKCFEKCHVLDSKDLRFQRTK